MADSNGELLARIDERTARLPGIESKVDQLAIDQTEATTRGDERWKGHEKLHEIEQVDRNRKRWIGDIAASVTAVLAALGLSSVKGS